MRRAYLMIYSEGIGGREAVRAWANEEPAVLHWRYDMPHAFYIISEKSAADLSESFMTRNGKKGRLLFVEGERQSARVAAERNLVSPAPWAADAKRTVSRARNAAAAPAMAAVAGAAPCVMERAEVAG